MVDYRVVKRGLDIAGSTVLLMTAAPIMGAIAVLVAKDLGRPVLFSQDRPGRDGKIFKLYKFRSMKDVDVEAGLVTDEDRLTEFGRLLRSTSLDELPSLVNVLKGDMSFVGPRPLLVRYLDRYTPHQARRHEVRPGVTGLAQISGRNALGWEERFDMDVDYVDHISGRLDAEIVWKTFSTVMRRSGINAEGEATMSEFRGTAVGQ